MPPQTNNRNFFQAPAVTPRPQHSRGAVWLKLLVVLLLVGFLWVVIANRQGITDWWRLRNYQPPAAISRLAEQDTMTDEARRLFYLNHPEILDSVELFRERCPDNKDTVVLGCYRSPEGGIFIYNVKDPKLQGVVQVTAAHEMLHAAYDRLDAQDKKYVNGLLDDYYKSGQASQRVKDEIALYRKTAPDALMDEMHSMFGTELANLPAPLENYYKRYFSNRSAVVAYEQQYEQEFDSRQAAIAQDDQQLVVMKQQIDEQESALTRQLQVLQSERDRLESMSVSSSAEYSAAASAYNGRVATYNAGVGELQQMIRSYNQLVAERNRLAGELTTLDQAIDTRLQPQDQ